jgi:hypothetical protein
MAERGKAEITKKLRIKILDILKRSTLSALLSSAIL